MQPNTLSTVHLEEAPEEVRVGEAEEGEGEVGGEAAVEDGGADVHQGPPHPVVSRAALQAGGQFNTFLGFPQAYSQL